jgi:cytoskeleton protein RodZ
MNRPVTNRSRSGMALSESGRPAQESRIIAAERPGRSPVMPSIGSTLRDERLRQRITLEQVATATKIGPQQLKAMEADQFDLPIGSFFMRSFLRQYANMLGLDGEGLVTSLNEQCELAEPLPEPRPEPRSFHPPRLPALAWVLVMLFCVAAYSLWENRQATSPGVETSAVPQHEASRASLRPGIPPVAQDERLNPVYRPPVSNAGTGQTVAGSRGPGQQGASAMRVTFTATEPVWLSIKSDGSYAYTGILGVQQSKEIEAAIQMKVLVGNAGGLDVSLNGRRVGPIGARGEVQLLELTPTGGVRILPHTQTGAPPSRDGDPR